MAIQGIRGIGPKKAEALEQMGISSLEDALSLVPCSYMDFTKPINIDQAQHMKPAFIIATLTGNSYPRKSAAGVAMLLARCADATGAMTVIWFNQPYMFGRLQKDKVYKFYGKVQIKDNRRYLINPVFEPLENDTMRGICPVYSIPKGLGISQNLIRTVIAAALDNCEIPDAFTKEFRMEYHLADKGYALENIHFPLNRDAFDIAKRTVANQELLMLIMTLSLQKELKNRNAVQNCEETHLLQEYSQRLPYKLTNAQIKAINAISEDISGSSAMNRLLQGDVGSGKTAVAFYLCFVAAKNRGQCVLMAPTEILARQHFNDFSRLFPDVSCCYVNGAMKKSERKAAVEAVNNGEVTVIIGTHAVLNDEFKYNRLLFVITDEQHRFGVGHRAALEEKGNNPHTLVLSATPIPRTLALVLYNDLDISVLDELPPGRQKITTAIISSRKEEDMFAYIEKCANEGVQSYVVCPLVEHNEDIAARSAQEIYQLMQRRLGDKVALVHGKMKNADKKDVMDGFASGRIQVLVATTVIEVGVNVPNAVNMVIVDADRFGLAQLHQLRGRVGRGDKKSYCFLLSDVDNERLEIMTKSNDGFVIAETDLKMRGPGDYFGLRQSGLPATDFSALFADMKLIESVKDALVALKLRPEYRSINISLRSAAQARLDEFINKITYN